MARGRALRTTMLRRPNWPAHAFKAGGNGSSGRDNKWFGITEAKRSRSEERRVGKEGRSLCDWSSDVCSSDLTDPLVSPVFLPTGAGQVAAHHTFDGQRPGLADHHAAPAQLAGPRLQGGRQWIVRP